MVIPVHFGFLLQFLSFVGMNPTIVIFWSTLICIRMSKLYRDILLALEKYFHEIYVYRSDVTQYSSASIYYNAQSYTLQDLIDQLLDGNCTVLLHISVLFQCLEWQIVAYKYNIVKCRAFILRSFWGSITFQPPVCRYLFILYHIFARQYLIFFSDDVLC